MSVPARYTPRPVTALGRWDAGDHGLKAYLISLPEATVPAPSRLEAARRTAAAAIPPAAAEEGESLKLGFVILHEGELGDWLLCHWWAHGDILCQRLFLGAPGGAAFEPVDHRPLMACVWEMGIIEAERRAWIETMMTGTPAPDAYLARRHPDGPA